MIACRNSPKNIGKISFILNLNNNLPHAHTELEFDVLGVHRKLVINVILFSKRKN